MTPDAPLPPCPITGAPAAALVERVSAKLLHDLWRRGAGVEPSPLRRDQGQLGLYRSGCGLMFFDPAPEGDGPFYRALYARFRSHEGMGAQAAARGDFRAAAAVVRPGDRVLDVGCGHGAFAALVPGVRYQGLDPFSDAPATDPPILPETVEHHAARCPGAYDVVCAFQVLEHVAAPLPMARAMAACLRPGGVLVLAMPLWPSPVTRIQNNLMNLPPHHLTWWNEAACAALAGALGLDPVSIGTVPASRMHALLHWTLRLTPLRTTPGRHVRPGLARLLVQAAAFRLAGLAAPLFGLPRGADPVDVVLVARKPPDAAR